MTSLPSRSIVGGVVLLAWAGCATVAAAQASPVPLRRAEPPDAGGVFTNAYYHLAIELLAPPTRDYTWNTEFGGEVDVVDYRRGRVNVLAHYEAVLGREQQRFDPVQGNYTLQALGSWRRGRGEVAGFLYHVSRHLGDRQKTFPFFWNTVGAQFAYRAGFGGWTVDATGRGAWVVARQHIDYRATVDGEVSGDRLVRPTVSVVARAATTEMFVGAPLSARPAQWGYRAELGVRVRGRRALSDVYVAAERRFDADILTLVPHRAFIVGWRVLSPD